MLTITAYVGDRVIAVETTGARPSEAYGDQMQIAHHVDLSPPMHSILT